MDFHLFVMTSKAVEIERKRLGPTQGPIIHRTGISLCKRVGQKMAAHGAWPPSDKGVEPRVYHAKRLSP